MILKDTANSVLGTSRLWRSTVAFTYLNVKSAKCLCLLLVVLVLFFWSWSWSCYFDLVLRIWSCLHHWQPHITFSLEVTGHVDDADLRVPYEGHRSCRWCGSPYSTRIPSLKFIGRPISKIWLIFGHGIKRPGDLGLWSFWPSNRCKNISDVARTTVLPILVILRLLVVELWADVQTIRLTIWPYYLDLWPVTSPRMWVTRVIAYSIHVPGMQFVGPTRQSPTR